MFLFEQTLLEEKQGTTVTVPTPVTEAEMEEQFSQYMCESIRLETAMVKADRKCTEVYLEATTESDKESVKAIFEATVKDFVKKSKDSIVKAIQTLINWFKEQAKMIQTKILAKAKELSAKVAKLNKPLIDAMDKVEVDYPIESSNKRIKGSDFSIIWKEVINLDRITDKSEIDELIEDLEDFMSDKALGDVKAEIGQFKFSEIKKEMYDSISPSNIGMVVKDHIEHIKFMNDITHRLGSIKDTDPLAKEKTDVIIKVNRITRQYGGYLKSVNLAMIVYSIKGIAKAMALAPKHMAKKEATKESVSLLEDMLVGI